MRKSETLGSIERTSLGKVEKNRVLAERGKKKKKMRKEESEKNKETCKFLCKRE